MQQLFISIIYSIRFKNQTLELLWSLSIKIELPAINLQDISFSFLTMLTGIQGEFNTRIYKNEILAASDYCFRISHRRCSVRTGVHKNFANLTGKHLCQSLFFDKVAGLGPATLLKKRLWHSCLPVSFLRTSCLQNTSRRLLLLLIQPVGILPFHCHLRAQTFSNKVSRQIL